jgi:hypothetical protein
MDIKTVHQYLHKWKAGLPEYIHSTLWLIVFGYISARSCEDVSRVSSNVMRAASRQHAQAPLAGPHVFLPSLRGDGSLRKGSESLYCEVALKTRCESIDYHIESLVLFLRDWTAEAHMVVGPAGRKRRIIKWKRWKWGLQREDLVLPVERQVVAHYSMFKAEVWLSMNDNGTVLAMIV